MIEGQSTSFRPLDPATPRNTQTYDGIAEHYDLLMTSGYYDYDRYGDALAAIVGPRRTVLELGVGTGLVAEGLLRRRPDLALTGIDNTRSMLEQAEARLSGRMRFSLQDVTKVELADKYQVAYSVGGCWYFIDETLQLCSHIPDRKVSLKGLRRVVAHLEPGGLLVFALQGVHRDYSRPLRDGYVYEQQLSPRDGGRFTKRYIIREGEVVVGEQYYDYLLFEKTPIDAFFASVGCVPVGLDPAKQFYIYRKEEQHG